MKKLMLIDGMSMVYRAYYALQHNPRINSKGVNTSATLGFTMTLYDLLRTQKPSHIAVAFDLQTPTFRHEQYEPYKANREKMPEDIQASMPHIEKIIEAFRIPVITCEGYEADDIIGTASAMAENEGFDEILMVTGDKDFAQLVSEKTHLYRFGRMGKPDSIYKVAEVQEAFDVERPAQVADILGLWGDSIDNIPGIPGVGEKKAKKLIRQFGSVETLLQHVDEIKNEKLRDQIMQYRDQALLSKHLATIVRDAPIEFSVSRMKVQMPDYWSLKELFAELEFRQFAKKFFTDLTLQDPETAIKVLEGGSQKKASLSAETNSQEPHGQQQTGVKMEFMDRSNQLSLFDGPEKVHPSELTTGDLAIEQHHLAGKDLAICFDKTTVAIAVDADKAYSTTVDKIDAGALKALLESDSLKICYDLKNLKYILQEWDVQLKGDVFDVQLAHYLIDAEARHTLDFISSAIIGFEPSDTAACAAALWQLYPLLLSKLREGKLEKLYYEVELPLVDVLVAMEQEGVRIDVGALKQYSARLTEERNQLEQDIYVLAGGRSFNIASPKQLGEILYDSLKIVEKPPRTATKQYSTAEDVLLKMRDKHPIVEKILEFRSLNKLIGTYLDSFPKLIIPATGRLHTIYNQTVTATGRLSSSNPNLQNIPIRTERGREIRKAFVARNSEYVIMAADYSQIELRIIASLANDRHMTEYFANHYDIHAATAAKIFGIPMEKVSSDQRRNAKSVNFGIIYGISAFGLSEQLGVSRKEAATLIEDYFRQFPDIKKFIDSSIAFAHEHGYAQTRLGRRRYLTDINSRNASARSFAERNAVNMPIQGTSADMIKLAMIRIFSELNKRRLKSKMILQVHDELVFDVYRPEEAMVRAIVEDAMLNALPLTIPIEIGIGVGDNWLEAH